MKLLDYGPNELSTKLEAYLKADANFRAVYSYTNRRFDEARELPGHNWAHIYRDTLNALVLGESEHADMRIVLPAIAMHDIGFLYGATGRTHGAIGADKLTEYLGLGGINYSDESVKKIADCIRTHKGSMHNEKPDSLEAKIVADADLLEKFGPFGVYQYIRAYTEFNRSLDDVVYRATGVLTLTLETPTGQRLAEPGRQFVADFFNELKEAAQPYESS